MQTEPHPFWARVWPAALSLCGFSLLCCAPVAGQTQNPDFKPYQAFPHVFARYTGMNGYEDLVIAADAMAASAALSTAEQDTPTLKQMRAAVEDPNVERALAMVHSGLDKPIQPPRDPSKMDELTTFPEYAGFRRIARVLAMDEYVALADGRVARAIEIMREGLRLAYVIQSETLISGLVGVAIDAIVVEAYARHFDQMSLRDCQQTTAVAEEWLKLTAPTEIVLNQEQVALRNMLSAFRTDHNRLRELIKQSLPEGDPESEGDLAALELSQFAAANDAALDAVIDQTLAQSEAEHRAVIAEVRKLPYQRKPLTRPEPRATMVTRLCSMLTPTYQAALDRFDIINAKMHLLAVNGLIRRFRWENNRLPGGLEELKRPDLTTDPFTGEPFVFKQVGAGYDLHSRGPGPGASGTASGPIFLPKQAG